MGFSKTTPVNVPVQAFPSPLFLDFYNYLSSIYPSRLSFIHPLPNPASSLAGRVPPYGAHSRHKGVLCLPTADFRQESGKIHKEMKTLRVFALRRGTPLSTRDSHIIGVGFGIVE
jgi:hypothetical protein